MSTGASTTSASVLSEHYILHQRESGNSAPTVVIASNDPEVRRSLSQILTDCGLAVEFVAGFTETREFFSRENIAACLCGFALEDGTYRDVVKFYRHQSPEVPVIIASTPECCNEYDEYLASMNVGAFDFLCYPYQRTEVQRILRIAITHCGLMS